MRTITKIVFVLLFVSVLLIPISVHATSYSSDDAIAWLQEQKGRSIDYDGQYGAQCVDLIMAYYKYLIGYNVGGDADNYATNTLPSGWTRTKNGQPQKGDILVYAGGTGAGHIAIYESDNVTWHQNYNGQYVRRVTNKHYTSFVAFDGATYWGCIHPNFNDYVHIKDDSYDTNFKAFPYAKITNDNLFDAGHNKMNANNWIAATDECTILEVYTDGCCKVTYPLDSGGTRTLYSKISLFNIVYECDHSYTYKSNSTGHWKECTLCGEKQTSASHTYTNDCDASCNTCGYTRTVSHTYSTNCDTSCNVCGATRTITHTYGSTYSYNSVDHWKTCTVCGHYEYITEHSYSNSCDTTCNTCDYQRSTPPHTYSNGCDTSCNACGATRTVKHIYDNDCDTQCNTIGCGYTRIVEHTYDNDCDTDCNVCGSTRTAEHIYDNNCDTFCNVCHEGRFISHTFDNDCDPTCSECNFTRTIQHQYDTPYDKKCNICGEKRTVEDQTDDEDEEDESGMDTATIIIITGTVGILGIACATAIWGKKK